MTLKIKTADSKELRDTQILSKSAKRLYFLLWSCQFADDGFRRICWQLFGFGGRSSCSCGQEAFDITVGHEAVADTKADEVDLEAIVGAKKEVYSCVHPKPLICPFMLQNDLF